MRLSALQKYILRESYGAAKRRVRRKGFTKFYKTPTPAHVMVDTITKSLERLIEKGLMIGYGRRTSEKWFIDEVVLTPLGRRTAKALLGEQQKLPLK
jgi:hypothetical protein